MLPLDTPIENLPKTAKATINRFASIGITTYYDLLTYIPSRYEDFRTHATIADILHQTGTNARGQHVTTKGTVTQFTNLYTRRGLQIQKAHLASEGHSIELVWFNQPYLQTILHQGVEVQVSGTADLFQNKIGLHVQEFDILREGAQALHSGRMVPVYSEKRGLSSHLIREKVRFVLDSVNKQVPEVLSDSICKKYQLITCAEAFGHIHFPSSPKEAKNAHRRLAFEELFIAQLSSQLVKQEWRREKVGQVFEIIQHKEKLSGYRARLPFKLTNAQARCIDEILADLGRAYPMNRLLLGDVGSGKTVVAGIAAYASYLNGFQTLLMAPTEILAQQHHKTFSKLFDPQDEKNPTIVLLTSSVKQTPQVLEKADIIIGTHAVITKKAQFSKVGLVIVDEQHKFGVAQRAELKNKGLHPHLLSMTATPIPRTVCLTLYGELDASLIDEMPIGRLRTKTYVVPLQKRPDAYQWIQVQIQKEKTQAFIVCPLIDESQSESLSQVRAATVEYMHLSKEVFAGLRVGLLHGRLKASEKETVMRQFAGKQLDILVSTPVVEVGVDVPNAGIIMIEAAERFGLAQLHQLRGRVGRSDKQAYCLVFSEKLDPPVLERLNFFSKITSGFVLAEYDLQRRGSGEVYGTRQHGESELKIASLTEPELVQQTHTEAVLFADSYSPEKYPALAQRLESYQTKHITRD